jgi:hypothetical protein
MRNAGNGAACMSASVMLDNAAWMASFTGSQRPRIGQRPWDSHPVFDPSTHADCGQGPVQAITALGTALR